MCEFITETEVFLMIHSSSHSRRTFLGILFYKISLKGKNYDTRIQKTVELFYIFLKNRLAKPKLITWITKIINQNKNFKNNLSFYQDFDKGLITPAYYKTLSEVFLKLWNDAKNNEKNKFEKLNIEYLKNTNCLLEWEEKDENDKSKSRLEMIFFIFLVVTKSFFNNFESMIKGMINI